MLGGPGGAAYDLDTDAPSVEDILRDGRFATGGTPTHIAFIGTPVGASIRCDWRGAARTLQQREHEIRFWLNLDANTPLPSPSEIEAEFMRYIAHMNPQSRDTTGARLLSLARGGVSEDYLVLACYANYTVTEYLLGAGPTTVTVAYDRAGERESYEIYRRQHGTGRFGDEPLMTQGAYENAMATYVANVEGALITRIGGRSSVVFLAPMGAHGNISIEVWMVIDQWDLWRDSENVTHAVRQGTTSDDPEHTQTLANLKSRIAAAIAPATPVEGDPTPSPAPTRIANVSGLGTYYTNIGAQGDITPGDGTTTTFTPAPPPTAYACTSGTAVSNAGTNRALVHDCEALLDSKDTLRGTASLNWATSTAISSWDGITTGGTPSRVTKLELGNESLSGSIPVELGSLFELTHLDLSRNSLTGDIPRELGWLYNLISLKLSGNTLTGCIPLGLKDVATNDLASLNLLYCQPPGTGEPGSGDRITWGRERSPKAMHKLLFEHREPDDAVDGDDPSSVTYEPGRGDQ